MLFTCRPLGTSFASFGELCRRFIPYDAAFLQQLSSILAKKGIKGAAVAWNDDVAQAFVKVKKVLASVAMLAHLNFSAPSSVTVDASDTAVGVVFQQIIDGAWQ